MFLVNINSLMLYSLTHLHQINSKKIFLPWVDKQLSYSAYATFSEVSGIVQNYIMFF